MSHGPVNYDEDRLESLLFNPIDRPELGNMLSSYLDPDSNFEFHLPSSNYHPASRASFISFFLLASFLLSLSFIHGKRGSAQI